ncbi:hypothetical protein D1AOALGA4SA_2796 [Olavius algarvensis Delta 1 endosymbiont]|nr:hypothetical protein D1AOALGA4SA_2796 [Olavius algarvensis Delta 1 endosymbiont]
MQIRWWRSNQDGAKSGIDRIQILAPPFGQYFYLTFNCK